MEVTVMRRLAPARTALSMHPSSRHAWVAQQTLRCLTCAPPHSALSIAKRDEASDELAEGWGLLEFDIVLATNLPESRVQST
mmetsp:Transcript_48303/g.103473  ORF Transcript_48303/g.103473 Transcript_48303/m.103473 type:complete len:82 (-) Transcript_48303:197-442(-)